MDPKLPSKNEDTDSGLDNTSESGQSGDEDHQVTVSDLEETLTSDNEGNFNKKETTSVKIVNIVNVINDNDALIAAAENFKTELNNNEELIPNGYRKVVQFYKDLALSQSETVDFSISSTTAKPEWLDVEKFKRGQKFAREHLFCINFAEMLSLFILFAQKSSLGPLIFTGKSDSPFTAFRRYLNTLTKLMSWYEDDLFSESDSTGKNNLTIVRGMHKSVYHKLTNSSPEELTQKTTLGDPNTTALWCPLKDLVVQDFREVLPLPRTEIENSSLKKVWVNQADMSMTQFGFVGLAVTYPEYFGIYFATDEDLDAFLHLWRGLGYYLGVKDEYNYCNESLDEVRLRTKFFLEVIAKPAFRNVTCDWEHMCRCLTAGIAYYLPLVNFESALLYLCRILDIDMPRLKKQMSWKSYIVYQLHRLTFYLMKYKGVLKWLNSKLYLVIRKVQNAPPDVMASWENKEFSYMKQPGKCPIRGNLLRQ